MIKGPLSSLSEPTTTVVKAEQDYIMKLLHEAGTRTAASNHAAPTFNIVMDKFGPELAISSLNHIKKLKNEFPKYKVRYILDLQKENLDQVKLIVESLAVEVRHLEGIRANFAVTQFDYFSYVKSLKEGLPKEIVWSNDPNMIVQTFHLFERLWESGIPAGVRMKQLEEQIDSGETKLLTDPDEISRLTMTLTDAAERDVSIITVSEDPILRHHDFMKAVSRRIGSPGGRQNKMKLRLLIPLEDANNRSQLEEILHGADYRIVDSSGISFCIYDKTKAILVQYSKDVGKVDSKRSLVSAVLTTNKETILGLSFVFEALWRQSELREAKERTARQANLLQDIISHDIRNYNQVIKLSAELLQDELGGDQRVKSIVDGMLTAVDGSTALLERTKKLGKILSEERAKLYPVDALKAIREGISLIRAALPEKDVEFREELDSKSISVLVQADDFLVDVFTNLFSNSAKYTNGSKVEILVRMEETQDGLEAEGGQGEYWRISISDNGTGIPNEMKDRVFERYLSSAKGSGLGMSIVHALVVERYKGSVSIRNRVGGDHTKGTVVDILLAKA